MAKKRNASRPVRVGAPMRRWLVEAAKLESESEGRTVSVVEVSSRVALALIAYDCRDVKDVHALLSLGRGNK